MLKEIKFDNYIRENGITFFEKVYLNSANEAVAYRANHVILGNNVIFFIVVDNSVYTTLRCRLMKLHNPAKKENLLYLLNQLNYNYKVNKYILTEDDYVELVVPFITTDESFDPSFITLVAGTILESAEDDYAKIMRIIWS